MTGAMAQTKPFLSVVAPIYNEEKALPEFHRRLAAVLKESGLAHEIIYVDDGSTDSSPALLRALSREDAAVRALWLSRNFGHQLAITAGLDRAAGDACVIIDADGQDPPELIPELVESWRAGHEVVYAVRSQRRGEGPFKRLTAALFYRVLRRISPVEIPLDAGDFRLVDRKVLAVLRDIRESHRFMRGLTSWVGFRQGRVEYERQPRLAGETQYPLWRMIAFALDAVTSFSHQPLRWVTLCGAACFLVSIGIGVWVTIVKLRYPLIARGWTSLMGLILMLGGVQLIAMGMIGEYLARVFEEVKRRPL